MPPAEQYYSIIWTTFWENFMIFSLRMPLTILWGHLNIWLTIMWGTWSYLPWEWYTQYGQLP